MQRARRSSTEPKQDVRRPFLSFALHRSIPTLILSSHSPASYFKLSVDVADDRPPLELNYNTKGRADPPLTAAGRVGS